MEQDGIDLKKLNKTRIRDADKALVAQQAKRLRHRGKEDTENHGDNEMTMQGSFLTTSHEMTFKPGRNRSVAQEFKL